MFFFKSSEAGDEYQSLFAGSSEEKATQAQKQSAVANSINASWESGVSVFQVTFQSG